MAAAHEEELTQLERAVADACRKVTGYRKPIGPTSKINGEIGVDGDDGDMLFAELISSTGLAIGPTLAEGKYFGSEGFPPWHDILDWLRGIRFKPLTVRDLAASLCDDRALAAEQLETLNQFWNANWTLPDQGSSSTSQYR
jgi:hypothetical protein